MADLSNMAQQMGLEMPDLDKAIESLKGSDIDQFLKNMEFSAQELEKMAELSKRFRTSRCRWRKWEKTAEHEKAR